MKFHALLFLLVTSTKFISAEREDNFLPAISSAKTMAGKILSTGIPFINLPESYIRSELDRPKFSQVINSYNIPLIDLSNPDREQLVRQIGDACRYYGFFQVVNHGISKESMQKMLLVARDFFYLSIEEKMKYYSDDPSKKIRLSTSFNVKKEKVNNWRDYLRIHCYPLEEYVHEWPSSPAPFRDVVGTYSRQVRELGTKLLEAISESLGLEKDYTEKLFGDQGEHMAINYYPPCPEPELTYGLPAHTDPNTITVLLQDQEVAGLQVLLNGKWVAVNPYPDALVVNLGDQIQALSNGRYRSVWHRAVVNPSKERLSVAAFLVPCSEKVIGPAEKLTSIESPPIYRSFTYEEYYRKFWSRSLDEEHCLELFKNGSC